MPDGEISVWVFQVVTEFTGPATIRPIGNSAGAIGLVCAILGF